MKIVHSLFTYHMFSIEELYQKYLINRAVTIDARHVPPGALFFAIRGTRFNGNAFAAEALAKGASYAIIDDPAYAGPSTAYIVVEDSLSMLVQLASYHRSQYGPDFSIIAVTGSYGKTTTKELIYSVLSTTYRTVATKGNLNTIIGIALTLLKLAQDTQIAVIEMGATQLDDIALCCKIVQPTHGLITAIGEVHLEVTGSLKRVTQGKGFGTLEGVIQGKGELYDYLYITGGIVFLNTLDPLLLTLSKRFTQPITYPQATDYAPLDLMAEEPFLRYRSAEGAEVTTHLLGKSHIYNIAAALCVAKYFKVAPAAAHQAIQAYIPANKRMEFVTKGSNQFIIDSYNASPASVQLALDALLQLKVRYRVVILGDMAELGSQTTAWHNKIVKQLLHPGYDLVLLCGAFFMAAVDKVFHAKMHGFANKEVLADYLRSHHFQHSGILFKGGNTVEIHTLVELVREP
ncbi:UDP-N-acetylmuramoyl-tripeptide--D-alanyl-D-alanine ligase [Candidatus Cardinium hertigii]|nr:UDP-N-acetylmuramoyl-tripeptide--D-alanyl-D-alanine ligase [Candidatus Cardinium hertigii]